MAILAVRMFRYYTNLKLVTSLGFSAINPDAEISVEYISDRMHPVSEQPDRAKEMALAQYASGVDVIYAAAGGSGNGVLEAAQEQGKYIIWVDSNGNYLAPGRVLTSMVKELSASVERVIGETVEDNFMAGVRYLGLEDGGVSYAVDEHNEALLSAEILEKVKSLKAKIIAGEIVVPNDNHAPTPIVAENRNAVRTRLRPCPCRVVHSLSCMNCRGRSCTYPDRLS